MSSSQTSSRDFEQADGDQLFLRDFLKATCWFRPTKTFRFIRTDVAINLTRTQGSDELKLYMAQNHGGQDMDKYLRVLAKYPSLYPQLRFQEGPYYTPIRSKAEIEAYLKNGAVNALNENDLRLAFVESEIIILRRVYHYLRSFGKKEPPLRVNRDIFKGIKGDICSLMTLVFGFGAHKTFLKLHPDIFNFSTIDNSTFVSLNWEVDLENYISNAERFKVPEDSATFIARGKQEVKTVGLLVIESIKIAGETRVVFNNEMSQILNNKYVGYPDTTSEDLKWVLNKYSAIFQPIISLSNSKKPKCIGYYIAPQPDVYHILNSSADQVFKAVKVPPKEIRVLEHQLKAVKREIACLKAVHEVLGGLSVECGLEAFQHLVNSLFNNANKKFITDYGIEEFLEKYAEFFDYNDKGLYKLRFGSEELLLAHSEALLNAGRNLFRDAFEKHHGQITSFTIRDNKNEQRQMATAKLRNSGPQKPTTSAGETRVANRIPEETTTVRVLVQESIKIAAQSRVIFVDEMNQILNDKRDTSNANLKRILDKYSAIFQPIISLTNAKKPECIIGYCIASQSKMNLVLNSSPDRVFEAVKVPPKEIKIIVRQFERIKSEISSLNSVRGQLLRQFNDQFTRSQFINMVHHNIRKADAQFIKKYGFENFLVKHKAVFIFPPPPDQQGDEEESSCEEEEEDYCEDEEESSCEAHDGFYTDEEGSCEDEGSYTDEEGSCEDEGSYTDEEGSGEDEEEEPYDYELRLASEESFNLYIASLLMVGRNLFREAFEKHSGEDAFGSLSFNECLYQDGDDSYLDLLSSLVRYQPDQESLSLLAAAAVCDKSTQTDSSGLVSSIFLYPI